MRQLAVTSVEDIREAMAKTKDNLVHRSATVVLVGLAFSIGGCAQRNVGSSDAVEGKRQALPEDESIRDAVTFYASFDNQTDGDFGQSDVRLWTRADDPAAKGKKTLRVGFDEANVRLADGGVNGGALQLLARSPDNAFVFFPAAGKLAMRKGGWGGAVSLWLKAELAKIEESGPWDPFLLVEKGWNDGAVWCDFAPGRAPRDLRIGLFPAVSATATPPTLDEGENIWLRIKAPPFDAESWHHLVQVWDNFDSDSLDAWTACYLDGKLVGKIEGRDGTMAWDLDHVRFHIGSGLIGMIDEVALFGRPITEEEISRIYDTPGIIGLLFPTKNEQ
jgi:hypothetical protein